MDQFSHHGTNDEHGRLAGCSQTRAEGLAPSRFAQDHHRRHIERLTQKCLADLGHVRLSLDAAARRKIARIKAGKGDRPPHIGMLPVGIVDPQNVKRALVQARNAIPQRLLVHESGIVMHVVRNHGAMDSLISKSSRMMWLTIPDLVASRTTSRRLLSWRSMSSTLIRYIN